uniref:6-bladed beta-propeller n=1 Tax=Candidatus Cryptobacteroides bacterium TaxID=3085639 RepID=UPI003FEF11E8
MSIGALLLAVCLCVAVLFDKSGNPSLPYSDIEGFTTIIEATDKSGVDVPADIVNNVRAVVLEETEHSIIGHIDKMIYDRGRFYVLDRKMNKGIYVFNSDGSFLFNIGRVGRGHGEYIEPTDFVIADTLVLVLDEFGKKFVRYGLDGVYRGQNRLNAVFTNIACTENGRLIMAKAGDNSNQNELRDYELFQIDIEGNILRKYYKNEYSMNFSASNELVAFGDKIYYARALRPGVCEVDTSGFRMKYAFDFGNKNLPLDYERQSSGDYPRFLKRFESGYVYYTGSFIETSRYVGFAVHDGDKMNFYQVYDKDTGKSIIKPVGLLVDKGKIVRESLMYSSLNGTVDVKDDMVISVVSPKRAFEAGFVTAGDSESNPVLLVMLFKR